MVRSARREDFDAVITLLESGDLPTRDLKPEHLDGFLLMLDGETLSACAGLETYREGALLRSVAARGDLRWQGLGDRNFNPFAHQLQSAWSKD